MSIPCPKCKKSLEPSGEINADGQAMTVYQCDDCVELWEFDGAKFPAALTFAVDREGRLFNPETLEPLPPFSAN